MEPRELYDPEDIEQLLIERAFDELLEEERAFVLRHLSDRTEATALSGFGSELPFRAISRSPP